MSLILLNTNSEIVDIVHNCGAQSGHSMTIFYISNNDMKLPTEKVDNDGDSDEVTNGSSNGHTQPQNEETISTMPTSVHDIALQSAIDAMFRSRKQTYQQFLHSFSHLTVGKEIIPAVGVSRGYTDYHQGRAIHMADSRIH